MEEYDYDNCAVCGSPSWAYSPTFAFWQKVGYQANICTWISTHLIAYWAIVTYSHIRYQMDTNPGIGLRPHLPPKLEGRAMPNYDSPKLIIKLSYLEEALMCGFGKDSLKIP